MRILDEEGQQMLNIEEYPDEFGCHNGDKFKIEGEFGACLMEDFVDCRFWLNKDFSIQTGWEKYISVEYKARSICARHIATISSIYDENKNIIFSYEKQSFCITGSYGTYIFEEGIVYFQCVQGLSSDLATIEGIDNYGQGLRVSKGQYVF